MVDAVNCALSVQRAEGAQQSEALQRPNIVLRIGINLGDVIVAAHFATPATAKGSSIAYAHYATAVVETAKTIIANRAKTSFGGFYRSWLRRLLVRRRVKKQLIKRITGDTG